MATGRLTKRAVDAMPVPTPRTARSFLWDDTLKGFGLAVTGTGVRSYIVQYRIGGRGNPTRRATIGQHGNPWTAEQARARAEELLELVRRKIDPIEADRERLAAERAGRDDDAKRAFSNVADSFVKHVEAQKLRSAADIAAVMRRDLKPILLDKPLPRLTRADVHDCIATIGKRSESAANKAHSWLHAMLAWAVDQGRYGITASPMAAMSPPFPVVKRKRVLADGELRQVLEGATALGVPFGAMVKLLALTGQRLREVSDMRWEEVDLTAGKWLVPGARTKNGLDNLCPMSAGAVAVLEAVQPVEKLRKGVVLTTNGKVPVSGFSRAKQRLDRLIAEAAAKAAADAGSDAEAVTLDAWRFHDLRRTLATGLQALGFPVDVTEAVINHVSGKRSGLVGVYQLYEYWDEKVGALATWDRRVTAILSNEPEGSNVIALAERRA